MLTGRQTDRHTHTHTHTSNANNAMSFFPVFWRISRNLGRRLGNAKTDRKRFQGSVILSKNNAFYIMPASQTDAYMYRAPEKSMSVLLSRTQAEPGRNFSQPRTNFFRGLCTGQAKVEKACKKGPAARDDARRRNHATLPTVIISALFCISTTLSAVKRLRESGLRCRRV